MRSESRLLASYVCTLLIVSCGGTPPPQLSPQGVANWRANQAVVIVGDIQSIAIALNAVRQPDGTPVLSDKNTRATIDVVEVALKTIRTVPESWRAATLVALGGLEKNLDALGLEKLRPYIDAARTVIAQIPEGD